MVVCIGLRTELCQAFVRDRARGLSPLLQLQVTEDSLALLIQRKFLVFCIFFLVFLFFRSFFHSAVFHLDSIFIFTVDLLGCLSCAQGVTSTGDPLVRSAQAHR